MAKLKKYKVMKITCPTCKGNGFVKVTSLEHDEMIHQCWDCDSEGEFYETSDNLIGDDDGDRNHDIKLH
jgi:DnaJ-class molecular chaperone|tara:strand:+ start:152 stop:358 length:207 start_codon:yes stop_codon:yes gene_type:complete